MANPSNKDQEDLINQLQNAISDEVGNMHHDNLEEITSQFTDILNDALKNFNSHTFDKDGFIQRLGAIDLGGNSKDVIKNVLNDIHTNYLNMDSINQSELLVRRDIQNICTQMSEMQDVIKVTRDGIVEANISTGTVSRSLVFENHNEDGPYVTQVEEIEKNHKIQNTIKNFIVPKGLMNGEFYIHAVPFAKLFAELEMISDNKGRKSSLFKESIPNTIKESLTVKRKNLANETNIKILTESVSSITEVDITNDTITNGYSKNDISAKLSTSKNECVKFLLENIEISNGSSIQSTEMSKDGFRDFLFMEYNDYIKRRKKNHVLTEEERKQKEDPSRHFMEALNMNRSNSDNMFDIIDQDSIDISSYKHIKGVYEKFLDPLRIIPLRIGRRIIGYYYVTTTNDLQTTTTQPNGTLDLTYQHYTRDKNIVDQLANMIISSFDKQMLNKNIQLKNEIVEIIMAHKFSEGKLNFIYIPEDEIIRFVVNEDENGKGHSMLEPSLFPARNYLMLNMFNMLYSLNNSTTRVHYLKSSGLNKNYAAQIQRTIRKFQQRRVNIDDIYSYQGVLNKISGIGEMVLPAGRNDYKALETDTIAAADNPISIEFLEQQRRQALSGTGAPHLLIINAIDEVDFAKTVEMANSRFNSNIASYKLDFNEGITEYYKYLLKWETDLDNNIIDSFRFSFNAAKQQELNITADMIQNFNSLVEVSMSIFFSKDEIEDEKGNPTPKQMRFRKEMAKKYLPDIDIDELEEIVDKVNVDATDDELQNRVSKIDIKEEDIDQLTTTN